MAEEKVPDAVPAEEEQLNQVQGAHPGTEANFFIQLLVGLLGTLLVAFAVFPFKDTKAHYIYALINNRGPIQYIELYMSFMVAAQIFLKQRIIRNQTRVMYDSPVELRVDLNDETQIHALRKNIVNSESYASSITLSRMDRLLGLWLATKDIGRVSGWASAESDRDTSTSDTSYSLTRVLIWAVPILGFIGTVQGLGAAVAGFASFLSGSAELSAIKGAIANVTIGLGVAFDTTFLALMLVTFLMFPLSSIQRREENLFVEVDIYLDEVLISKFPSPEQQPIVIENLEDSIEAAFRRYIPDPDRYDEVFTRSIEKAAGVVEERFANLTQNYEVILKDLTSKLSGSMAAVGETLQSSLQKVVGDMQSQEDVLLDSRRKVAAEEAGKLKGLLEQVHAAAMESAAEYKDSAKVLQNATHESMEKSLSAAQDLGNRMQEVARMAAGIEDLLHIQQAVEKSMTGLATSDEFRKTLEDLRQHLAVTDSFCNRLSKPRVITLREEPR
ncbi:MAG TPA: hypothetical protein DCZ95_03130 [Verrucomicrobia bacterium]|nr:MAG: hypothetical protein A2X46_02285 [Lentisphaerae bacterium GWF2_57_35]HBA83066.1 hypothetical protein [Verrucomicrobiota bacterium]